MYNLIKIQGFLLVLSLWQMIKTYSMFTQKSFRLNPGILENAFIQIKYLK